MASRNQPLTATAQSAATPTAQPSAADDFIEIGEGVTPYAEAGVSLSDLNAAGYFNCVTEAHRRKAQAYFAKHERPRQGGLFA